MSQRQQRVADLIHQQLAELLKKEVRDSRLSKISLTAVSISPDLKQAKVFYSLLENQNEKEVQKALNKATGYLRHLLAQATVLRYVPKLEFVYDESIERAHRISLLIERALKKDDSDESS
ncbi:ribosome-binding factor A [Coxiella burnetii]|uniref:Ribosome-binding factor A n=4 Tax=Coxiella burnetii TaxID=777 RepID=RBFA_COXBU|nr:ribosome-binding factor A [Coxiella burnetii]NP_820414.1 ribosome-binding factor A [Coxiella burnetii RSA 493]A9KBM2.1 RecName: Full=Ribosome-binding factor A [Coxiella burnetii Dugway 5J108-111]A9N8V5.1 RecName: Full=Ribosome-binding factor A [Coxiella burnetii RSA 331]B6J6B2.1 RecName: Full=Ribosome-binding factor A [Coxiella burnetii CbuK_Q154]Q83BS2.1 RecName: Full=Ribosome-binding factor A [Coxiella burnetii RSA 493]AAO90928.1 ribosome-binding factor A [Coxiella burnetii RSA 493]ABS7